MVANDHNSLEQPDSVAPAPNACKMPGCDVRPAGQRHYCERHWKEVRQESSRRSARKIRAERVRDRVCDRCAKRLGKNCEFKRCDDCRAKTSRWKVSTVSASRQAGSCDDCNERDPRLLVDIADRSEPLCVACLVKKGLYGLNVLASWLLVRIEQAEFLANRGKSQQSQ